MKTPLSVAGCLALFALSPSQSAHAQTPAPASPSKAATAQRTATRRATAYKGPKVVKDTKKLGREFIRDSKLAPKLVSPVKQ